MHANPLAEGRRQSQEALLVDYVRRLNRHRAGRRALHIHISALASHLRADRHLRIAVNTFQRLVRGYAGQTFSLANGDIVFICRGASAEELEAAAERLRTLFVEDAPAAPDDASGAPFHTAYDLERGYDSLLRAAEALDLAEQRLRRTVAVAPPAPTLTAIDAKELAHVTAALTQADLSALIRRQPICAMTADAAPVPVFNELYVSIADLQRAIAPTVNLAANRWLFQHLSETLDRRVLAVLPARDDAALAARFSLNLNVATLLSPIFLAFDDRVGAPTRSTLVLELQAFDILADFGAFLFARDMARERGYRVCVDGLTYLTLPLVDHARLGADFLKIVWMPEMTAAHARLSELRRAVERAGPSRIILCRCSSAAALETGQALGLVMFQGRHVDALLTRARKPASAAL
jgi:hypothetical protein